MFAVYSDQAAPCGLQISISGHHYGSAAHQHSGIATAVRFNHGLQFQMSYTFAKSLDTRSFDPAFSTVPTGRSQSSANIPFDNQDRSRNYARSDFDRRHALQGDFVWDLHSAMAVCGLTKMDGSTAWWADGRLPAFLRFSPDVPSLGTVVGTLSTTRF